MNRSEQHNTEYRYPEKNGIPEDKVFTDRAVAAMAALGVGDAAGDLGRDDAVRQRFGVLTRLLPEGKSTDDTEFTVLSARAILDCPGEFTAAAAAKAWKSLVLQRGGAGDRGGTPLYGALWNLSKGIEPPRSGMDNVMNNDDGAAMRAVPFGIAAYGDPDEAARLAGEDASVSHDGDGILAAQAIAASTAVALFGATPLEILSEGMTRTEGDTWLGRRMEQLKILLSEKRDLMDTYGALHEDFWTSRHSAAPEALPQVYGLYALSGGDFHKAFLLSANFGRDADTICALTLALCAASAGTAVIPGEWIRQIRKPSGVCLPFAAEEDLVDLGTRLAEYALRRYRNRRG